MDLKTFLLARIAEDEELARAAIEPQEMHPYGDVRMPAMAVSEWPDAVRGYLGGPWGEHAANTNPARVLAECAAKRAIVERWDDPAFSDQGAYDAGYTRAIDDAVRALATPYADHPDYQPEWAQEASQA